MKIIIYWLVTSFFILSCSSTTQVIMLDVRENQLFIQNKKTALDDFDKEINRITIDWNAKQLKNISFSLSIDGKSKIGIASDVKIKKAKWEGLKQDE